MKKAEASKLAEAAASAHQITKVPAGLRTGGGKRLVYPMSVAPFDGRKVLLFPRDGHGDGFSVKAFFVAGCWADAKARAIKGLRSSAIEINKNKRSKPRKLPAVTDNDFDDVFDGTEDQVSKFELRTKRVDLGYAGSEDDGEQAAEAAAALEQKELDAERERERLKKARRD